MKIKSSSFLLFDIALHFDSHYFDTLRIYTLSCVIVLCATNLFENCTIDFPNWYLFYFCSSNGTSKKREEKRHEIGMKFIKNSTFLQWKAIKWVCSILFLSTFFGCHFKCCFFWVKMFDVWNCMSIILSIASRSIFTLVLSLHFFYTNTSYHFWTKHTAQLM